MLLSRIMMALAVLALNASSMTSAEKASPESQCEYKYSDINNICGLVSNKTEDPDPNSPYLYLYEAKVSQAACVHEDDSKQTRKLKLQELWRRHGGKMLCETMGMHKAPVLKLAISEGFDSFVNQAAENGLDINRPDFEGRTPVDYIDEELQKPQPSIIRSNLANYRKVLVANGAERSKRQTDVR